MHAAAARHATACGWPQRRRYIRPSGDFAIVGSNTREIVNCAECFAACAQLDPAEHLARTGAPKIGPHGLPMYTCKKCGEVDEFTSESTAFGLCATCMAHANAPERP